MTAIQRRPSRRQFAQGLGAGTVTLLTGCAPVPFQRPPPPLRRIGYLTNRPLEGNANFTAFQQALQELGYLDGQQLSLVYRAADEPEQYPALVAELLRLPVDMLASHDTNAILAAKAATSTLPIVLTGTGDPVTAGLVTSIARPGGNITGTTATPTESLHAKQLERLKEAFPEIARVGVLLDLAHPTVGRGWQELTRAAQVLRLEVRRPEIRNDADFDTAFGDLTQHPVDALFTGRYPLTFRNRSRIVDFAAALRLPAMYPIREYVEAGGLMAYGVSDVELHRAAATYVDKILKGAKPTELPVERPTTYDFILNLKTAHALGLTLSHSVLAQATEVIQ